MATSQELIDKLIAGQLDLIRLEASARNQAFRLLTQLERNLKGQLAAVNLTEFNRRRISSLLKQTDAVIEDYYSRIDDAMDRVLTGTAGAQGSAAVNAISDHFIGEVDASIPSTRAMQTLVSDTLIMGAKSSDWWEKQSENVQFKFAGLVRQGVAEGDTLNVIARRVSDMMNTARSNAKSLVHTSIMEIGAETRKAVYRENDDIVEGIEQISTLDSSTTEICIAYDGATFTLDGEPTGDTDLPYNGGVPRHWGCRSVEVPITKSFKELGIDLPEPGEGERSSDDGPLPAKTTFADFLERMGPDYQDETLGEGRADLFREGKITLQQLLDLKGNPLTLSELEAKYA